jgi:hypothetical protein
MALLNTQLLSFEPQKWGSPCDESIEDRYMKSYDDESYLDDNQQKTNNQIIKSELSFNDLINASKDEDIKRIQELVKEYINYRE